MVESLRVDTLILPEEENVQVLCQIYFSHTNPESHKWRGTAVHNATCEKFISLRFLGPFSIKSVLYEEFIRGYSLLLH